MAVDRLTDGVREFAGYLDGLLGRLDRGGGWSGVFWQRDPDGMRACLEGAEVPPWDVVEALLEDFAAAYGPAAAAAERERARALHGAALTAYDARPGARDTLLDRLDVMLREQRRAAERQTELTRLLSAPAAAGQADSLRLDLAWAQDDHARATARCAELRGRLAEVDRRSVRHAPGPRRTSGSGPPRPHDTHQGTPPPQRPPSAIGEHSRPVGPAGNPSLPGRPSPPPGGSVSMPYSAVPAPPPGVPGVSTPEAAPSPAPAKPRKRRRGSARFAGVEDGDAPGAVQQVPVMPRAVPRGARFAGGAEGAEGVEGEGEGVGGEVVDVEAQTAVAGVVERLALLRAEGRSGEAHVLLAEAAQWPAGRFPALADALGRAGLGADWATLLWEAASLPAERLVAVAGALTAAGRDADGRQLLRQGVARPPEQIGAAVLRLAEDGREREAGALLDACVRVRTAEDAARGAAPDPRRLVPLLLRAAQAVSDERHWDLLHALRVAGHAV
ncbi:hypothetical protein [Streptomyces sp. NPDC001851]|uniref:hypothetical protein n=1 Tax=Streptomyces sp. NPDC001851 TaxID=3154529 RepID=UPI0033201AA5